jgi:hypothetical protein
MMLAPLRINKRKAPVVRQKAVPFPVGGWDTSSPLASMPEDRAVQLKNWFPHASYGEVRRGYKYHAWDVVSDTTSIQTLMAWRGPASSKMFAAGGGAIYDVTSNAAGTSAVTGLSSNRWQTVNMTTSAGAYLWICNGTDTCRHYNGSTWAAPALTGVTSADVINVNVHKKRLWMVVKDSTTAYYLGTEAVAGAATAFALGANFTRGGYLMAMATWTRDGGSGPDDYAVFISSEGQIALYQGTDPASSSTWALVGVFDVPAPIGRRCFVKYGADIALLTIMGVFPLSQLLAVDQSQVKRVALSDTITAAISAQAKLYKSNFGWEACVYPKGTRLIVNIPTSENVSSVQYVMNTLTGAWCEFEHNHSANCWLVYGDNLYFGGNEGCVYKADTGSADIDAPITAVGQSAYGAFGTANTKHWKMVKPLITAGGSNRPSIGVSTDFQETETLFQSSAVVTATGGIWDSSRWDQFTWGGQEVNISDWVGVVGIGSFGSIKFRAQTGVSVGGSAWGVSLWGVDLWGSQGTAEEPLRINGFIASAEVGGNL